MTARELVEQLPGLGGNDEDIAVKVLAAGKSWHISGVERWYGDVVLVADRPDDASSHAKPPKGAEGAP